MDLAKELKKRGKHKTTKIARTLGVSRSNLHKHPKPRKKRYQRKDDSMVLKAILEVTKNRATSGYPRVTAFINRERRKCGEKPWNEKRIYRVMQIHQLLVPKQVTRNKRPHLGEVITLKSNLRWCSDIFQVRCWNGETIYVAFSLDCHDREAMSYVAEKRPLFHGDIIRLMDLSVTHRFGDFILKLPQPIQWLTDQGPQYTADQTQRYGSEWGFDVRTTPAYSPESNGAAESFVKRFKQDYVYQEELWTAESVLRRLPEWFGDYNKNHPHSGLNMKSPLEYRAALLSTQNG